LFGIRSGEWCSEYSVDSGSTTTWNIVTEGKDAAGTLTCSDIKLACTDVDDECLEEEFDDGEGGTFRFFDLTNFQSDCLTCEHINHVHGTLMFNTFVWCQVFNEYNAKSLTDEWDVFSDLLTNHMFLGVSVVTAMLQILLIFFGGEFLGVSPLTQNQWLVTVALGVIALPVGIIMRFYPVEEDPSSFFQGGSDPASAKRAQEGKVVEMTPKADAA
jgi:hypothetical protein